MKRCITLFVFLFTMFGAFSIYAQSGLRMVTVEQRKPSKLPTVREADVIWKKTLWRIIDLRERMNQNLYFPTQPIDTRKNLVSCLIEGIQNGEYLGFKPGESPGDFSEPMTWGELVSSMQPGFANTMSPDSIPDDYNYQDNLDFTLVKQIMVKEVWFFNKQSSIMEVRIEALCPILIYPKDPLYPNQNLLKKLTFWVEYPETRNLLCQRMVFNPYNEARSMSFDDVFINRRFDAYIIGEANQYDNRFIIQYAKGEYALKEAKRIENEIFNWEQDVWEY
ncbi:gliding motility protein GldN [Halosquirtibacter xylanolyticus]|uniref:type IX secretion system ring protein PorN/GldN n=1 Tax=Halosquirtibacter xylanolyticus TaxID=3374599 RepID=UPI00374823FE|nr:gliding motility protein GldN [Prolixibacteraceae bacterium]